MHCRTLNSTCGHHLPNAKSTSPPAPSVMTTENVSRHCRVPPRGAKRPWLGSTMLYELPSAPLMQCLQQFCSANESELNGWKFWSERPCSQSSFEPEKVGAAGGWLQKADGVKMRRVGAQALLCAQAISWKVLQNSGLVSHVGYKLRDCGTQWKLH